MAPAPVINLGLYQRRLGVPTVASATNVSFSPVGSLSSTNVQDALEELDTEKQPLDGNLTAIAALSPSEYDVLQYRSGAWSNRSPTQLAVDLTNAFTGLINTIGDNVAAGWVATTFGTNPRYGFTRGNGSAASPSAAAGILGQFDFGGYYSTTQTTVALRLRIDTQGAFTSLATASARLRFQTVDSGGSLADRVTIAANGDLQMGSGFDTVISAARHHRLRSYTVATLPSAATAAELIYVSDDAGGAVPAFSDGTNWRRMTDRAIVS